MAYLAFDYVIGGHGLHTEEEYPYTAKEADCVDEDGKYTLAHRNLSNNCDDLAAYVVN